MCSVCALYHVVSLRDDADVGACRVEAEATQVPLEGTVHVHSLAQNNRGDTGRQAGTHDGVRHELRQRQRHRHTHTGVRYASEGRKEGERSVGPSVCVAVCLYLFPLPLCLFDE